MPVVSARFVKNPENDSDTGLYIELSMSTGVYTFPYDEIIHIQRFSNGLNGSITHATTQYTDIILAQQQQAVDDSQKSGRIKGLISAKAALKSTDVMKRLNEFKDVFMTSENTTGMGFLPGEYEYIPVDLAGTAIDSDLLDKTINHVYNYFGVNDKIINNSASELEYEQFIDNTIKPLVLQIEQEFTYKLFSLNEIYNFNKIEAELIDLEISSLSSKTAFYKEMVYGTIMSRNEIRKRLKLSPGPEQLDEFLENKNFQVVVNQAGGANNEPQS
jgi:HK97 family phage portal protein